MPSREFWLCLQPTTGFGYLLWEASGGEQDAGLVTWRMERSRAVAVSTPQVCVGREISLLNRNVLSSSHVAGTGVCTRGPAVTRTNKSCRLGSLQTINMRSMEYFGWGCVVDNMHQGRVRGHAGLGGGL